MRSIKFSKVMEIVRPEYVYLKLKPNNSIRNQGTYKIAKTIGSIYKTIAESMKREEARLIKFFGREFLIGTKYKFELNSKVGYYIYIEKKKVEFYLVVPKQHLILIKERITDVWANLTVDCVTELPTFGEDVTKYQMVYHKEDALSLAVDRRDNDLLNSTLNVIDVLEEGDKVGIFYNFIPISQFGWRAKYNATMEKVKDKLPVERNKFGISYAMKYAIAIIAETTYEIGEVLGGDNKKKEEGKIIGSFVKALEGISTKKLSDATIKKGLSTVLDTQIIVLSESQDKVRQRNNARSVVQSFDSVTEDNSLVSKALRTMFSFTDRRITTAEVNRMSEFEASNFIALAGREILERFNFIEKIETHQTEVPEDLQKGVMCIGDNIFRGKHQQTFLSNDEQFRNLLLLLIGPTRAGKSNLIANLSIDAIDAGECVIIFDFIENCELSDEVAQLFPKEKVLEIRCDNFDKMQGLGYNEVGCSNEVFKQYENAKRQTANMLALVNSINSDESRLSPKMERYLESASLVVFISDGSIREVFQVLQNHNVRSNFISKVPKNQRENLQEYIDNLHELDDRNKDGLIVGTSTHLIVGIIDRLNALKRNTYMELMLKKDTSANIDLSEEMQKNQLITIKMPQSMFTTDSEKDICTTYWITKIWLALQVRADKIRDKSKRTKVNLVIDELYQVENTEKFLTSKLSQIAKFIMKPIVSCHYINQLKHMRDELRSANTSYMLISGCDKKNFDELKHELYPFTNEDLQNLPRYYSMNYLKCLDGYSQFITRLPGKVSARSKDKPAS